jgi:GT2 family glycosyltransferase
LKPLPAKTSSCIQLLTDSVFYQLFLERSFIIESLVKYYYHLTPSVAIVILNWNGCKYLQQFLPSVLKSTYSNYAVIVADNASSDDSVIFLQQQYPAVKIIRLEQNFGFAKGYNEALRQVQADYFILLNSDVEVQPGWIEPVIELMESDKNIAACQPKILMERNKKMFEYAGAAGGWIDKLGYPFARGRVFETCEEDLHQFDNAESIFWASGAAMFVRPGVYHACGGLDEYFFAHMEEIDLCWRMQLAGYIIMACPQSVVYHVGGGTLPSGSKRKIYLNFRNNLVMLFKNLPLRERCWKIPCRLGLDALFAWKSLLTGDIISFIAVYRAHAAFMYWWLFIRDWQKKRRVTASGTLNGFYDGSIVWAYFVRAKRKFSEIIDPKPVKYKP